MTHKSASKRNGVGLADAIRTLEEGARQEGLAAAGDLLKAAKRALATFRAQGVRRDGNNVVAALEDAIAKAESPDQ